MIFYTILFRSAIFWLSTTLLCTGIIYSWQSFRAFVTIESASKRTYDYVIIGAGTTGSVLANRLSANTNLSILVIEAGTTFGFMSKIPILTTFQQKTAHDWQFQTVSQKFSSRGFVEQVLLIFLSTCVQ